MAIKKKKEDRRVRRTRKLMQDALITLLRRKPLAKIQIKEIVEEADVSRPTFYQHFETKERLLFSLVDDVFEKIHTVVFHGEENSGPPDIVKILTLSYEQWLLHSEELKWVLQIENKDLLIGALRIHIEAIKNEVDKHFPPSAVLNKYDDHVISFVSGGVYMLVKNWINNGMQESAETMGKITFLLLDNGLSPIRLWAFSEGASVLPLSTDWQTILESLGDSGDPKR